jgi:hypothetical protein
MVQLDNNSYVSLEQQMDYEKVGKVRIVDMAKPVLEILEGDNGNTILLKEEDDKYINLHAVQIIKTFDEAGEATVQNIPFPMRECLESDFQRNHYDH